MERRPRFVRDPEDRWVAGVCAGVGRRLGVDPLVVRIAILTLSLAAGAGIGLYLVLWAISDDDGELPPARPTSTQQAAAVGLVTLGVLVLLRDAGLWFSDRLAAPIVVALIGTTVIWVRGDEEDRARWTGLGGSIPGDPLSTFSTPRATGRLAAGATLVGIGVISAVAATDSFVVLLDVLPAIIATLAGAGLVLGPWIARLVRQLGDERAERIRGEERADVAAHLHDSVLQTLALIQRTDDPRRVSQLARSQERELRSWLYGRRADHDDTTLRALLTTTVADVEASHELEVDLVVVGDAPVDEDLVALVGAVREALVNAAKHAGVGAASAFVEHGEDEVVAYVRDRGAGFDPTEVPDDRHGVAGSIRARLARHGGRATLHTAPGDGTEWEFVLPVTPVPAATGTTTDLARGHA